jgi:hypothetical protein
MYTSIEFALLELEPRIAVMDIDNFASFWTHIIAKFVEDALVRKVSRRRQLAEFDAGGETCGISSTVCDSHEAKI